MVALMNRLIYEASAINRYATFFFGIFDPIASRFHYVNAGHNPPVLLRKSASGSYEWLRLECGGAVIGLLPEASYEQGSLLLHQSDVLLAYTDGISEAMNSAEEEWGEEAMILTAQQNCDVTAEDIVKAIFAAADVFAGGAPQHNDMTVLLMKVSPGLDKLSYVSSNFGLLEALMYEACRRLSSSIVQLWNDEFRRMTVPPSSPFTLISPNSDGWTIGSWGWADERRNEKKRQHEPSTGLRWLQGSGKHCGRLIGGCLEVIDWLRGTPVWPEPSVWRNSILFLETSEDQPSPTLVTYMLRSLAATGAFNEVQGILYGRPYGDEGSFEVYDDGLLRVLAELKLTSLPVITRMDFGHTDPKFVLPIGVAAEIDCDSKQLWLLESPTIS
jgi:hypothetical protein